MIAKGIADAKEKIKKNGIVEYAYASALKNPTMCISLENNLFGRRRILVQDDLSCRVFYDDSEYNHPCNIRWKGFKNAYSFIKKHPHIARINVYGYKKAY